jgi:multiple sugar transport system ATP-binding protein
VPGIALVGIGKSFGATRVLTDVSLAAEEGEFLAILGPSGCGKSTLLRIMAGLESPDTGQVLIGPREVTGLPARQRDLAMVFQSYALYPYMSVAQNIALPLEMRRLSAWQRIPLLGRVLPGTGAARRGIKADVAAVAEPLGLAALLARRPSQLSGGQRQRVALARAMVRHPAAFLMDEPLSNLDARLRTEARAEIAALTRRLGVTTLYVTHDQQEAMAMADRVAVMQGGRVLQCAPPQELYAEPADIAVARFVGTPPMNILPATVGADGRVLCAGTVLPFAAHAAPGAVQLGVRPEGWVPAATGLPASIARIEHLGAECLVHLMLDGHAAILRLAPEAAQGLLPGAPLRLALRRACLFGADGARIALHAREAADA